MIAAVHIITFMLPAHPIIALLLGILGLFLILRLAARFIEILPG